MTVAGAVPPWDFSRIPEWQMKQLSVLSVPGESSGVPFSDA
jgi:hypothetical protein